MSTSLDIIQASKNLVFFKCQQKQLKKWGIYPQMKSARWQQEGAVLPFRSTARSTGPMVRFLTVVPPVDRPGWPRLDTESRALCRSTGAISREQSSLDGRPARSTGPPAQADVHACARRSTAPIDRLLPRSTVPVDRQTASTVFLGFKNLSFYL